MRIVYICQWNPWRLNGGALIRNAWLLRALARSYPVDLVTADDDAGDVPPDFAQMCASISTFPKPAGIRAHAARLRRALRPGSSLYTAGNALPELHAKVRSLMTQPGAVAMVDLSMVDALAGTAGRFIYNAHNAEHLLWRRRAEHEPQPLRTLLRFESARIARIEAGLVRNASIVAACSDHDRLELAALVPGASSKIIVVPNGVDTERYAPIAGSAGERTTVLITGSFDWRPNCIGLEWFIDAVLPELRSQLGSSSFSVRVAGRMGANLIAKLNCVPNVTAVPNPPDMRPELQRARIVAAPILASSGTRLRILEAWAAGRPVVTTAAGALGLPTRDGEELLLADEPAAYADAVRRLLQSDVLWRHIQHVASTAVAAYDWNRIGESFRESVAVLLDGARAAETAAPMRHP